MRRANVQLQADRRFEILQAAQTCFARSGFHQTSMQEICTEAGMSPGNLYRYFRSKEEIIAGIAERDRADARPERGSGRVARCHERVLTPVRTHEFNQSIRIIQPCQYLVGWWCPATAPHY